MKNILKHLILISLYTTPIYSQLTPIGISTKIVCSGSPQIVLNDISYNNEASSSHFVGANATVRFTGSSSSESTVSSTASYTTSFPNVVVDRGAGVLLEAPLTITNSLGLENGNLDITSFNLDMQSLAINGGTSNSYVKTSSTGELKRNLASGNTVVYPVGRSTYNPVELNKAGSSFSFGVRVLDVVTANGQDNGSASTGPNMSRMWDITPASGYTSANGAVSVTLAYSETAIANFINGFSNGGADRRMYHFGSSWEDITNSSFVTSTYAPETGYVFCTQPGVTNFSPFTISNFAAVLPVELIAFTAHCQNEDVAVNWSTATEHNSQHYVLQVSEDGYSWSDLYVIEAAGFSTSLLEYAYIHKNAARTKNYYRLRQYDNDGTVETYNTILSNCASDEHVFMTFPNPSADAFTVLVNDKQLSGANVLSITDASGKLIYSIAVELDNGSGSFALEGLDLSAGLYYLQLNNGSYASGIIKHSFR